MYLKSDSVICNSFFLYILTFFNVLEKFLRYLTMTFHIYFLGKFCYNKLNNCFICIHMISFFLDCLSINCLILLWVGK